MRRSFRPTASLSALALTGVLAGCAAGFPGARPLTYATPGEARLFVSPGACPHKEGGEEAAGVAAAVLTGIASQLLTNFGTALQKGAEGGNLPSSTSTLNMMLDPGVIPKCIVIVRGAFEKDKRNSTAMDIGKFFGKTEESTERMKRLELFNFVPVYRVDHLIEIQVMASSNNKALTFAPIFVRIDRSIDGGKGGERDISVALKFSLLGADPVGSAVVVADRMIGHEPTAIGPHPKTQRFAREAPWFGSVHAVKPATDSPKAATSIATARAKPAAPAAAVVGGGGPGAGGGEVATIAGVGPGLVSTTLFSTQADAVPVTLTATVVETRPTNEGLAFIASVFNGVRPKLEEALKPIIDPSIKEAAQVNTMSSLYAAEADYSHAVRTAEGALVAHCKGASKESTLAGEQDRITKSGDARVAQLKANAAALKAGRTAVPYPLLVQISSLPDNASGCS